MQTVFNFKNFRQFIRYSFSLKSKNGFGQAAKLAKLMSVNSTFISQVLNHDKPLSSEQAIIAAQFLNLNEIETNYFVLLVQKDRSGTKDYREYLEKQLQRLREQSNELVNRVQHNTQISEEQRSVYYSDWVYSAIRLSAFLPSLDSPERIAEYLNLPVLKVKEVIQFLLNSNLLILNNGKLSNGIRSTHLDGKSPWIKAHHSNWRHKAIHEITYGDPKSMHYTSPMTLSANDAEKIREVLIKAINHVDDILKPSPSEELYCLNMDWFRVR